MTRLRLLAFVLVLGAAAPAAAATYSGYVGLQYNREDLWMPEVAHQKVPRLDLQLGLSLDGFVYAPGAFSWSVSGDYRRHSDAEHTSQDVQDHLEYRARAVAFGDPRTPLSISGLAQRTLDQASSAGSSTPGVHLDTQVLAVDARYRQPDRPQLGVGYARTETTNHVSGLPDSHRNTDTLGVNTSHGTFGFSYSAAYVGNFNDGSYATDNFDDHRVTIFARAQVAERTEARLSDGYYLRLPSTISPFSPRQEFNNFNAVVSRRTGLSDFDLFTYANSTGNQTAPGATDLSRAFQQLGYSHQHTLANPEWRLRANVDATLSQNRVGTTETRDAGQAVGAGVTWARNLPDSGYVEVRGGPSVGLIEPDGGSVDYGFAATLGGTYRRLVTLTTYEATYDVSFSQDIGDLGTSFRQTAQGAAVTPVGLGAVRGQLQLSSYRRDSPRVGASAYRSATLTGAYGWKRYSVSADGSITSGVTAPVQNAGFGDGLFLSLPYDSHTYTASVGGNAGFTDRLNLAAVARYVAVTLPDRPDTRETELRGTIRYTVGALTLQLEDRYTISEVTGGTTRRNLFFFSVYRSFGSSR